MKATGKTPAEGQKGGKKQDLSALITRAQQPVPDEQEELTPPETLREEKLHYNRYYDRIYPWVRSNKLNYEALGEATGISRRRVRESLLFRLGSGQIRRLFGHEPGYCFVCKGTLRHKKTNEPICLHCLKVIDSFLNRHKGPVPDEFHTEGTYTDLPDKAVEFSDFNDLAEQSEPSGLTEHGLTQKTEVTDLPSADDILAILSDDEPEAEDAENIDINDINPVLISARADMGPIHLKHYGFKRLKRPQKSIKGTGL